MIGKNVINVSGGKDSTALLLLAIERGTENITAVFADTGNEHEQTYAYIQYLSETVLPIRTVRADFASKIENKAEFVRTKWAGMGVPQAVIDTALAALKPTGNPFLDLCVLKGRFPSTKAAFCSGELKRDPIFKQVQLPMLDAGDDVVSWQGVRRDESLNRRFLVERELKQTHANGAELWNYRPILDLTAADCFALHKKHGIKHNPLYEQGMGRVGCMPCINCRKDELLEISKRFPEAIDRIARWEIEVGKASKHGYSTFMNLETLGAGKSPREYYDAENIRQCVEWSKTKRGGKLFDLFRVHDTVQSCTSIYGLCE
jgi:3'-phosphoadenosine 5'-phosphosulfate sulfotransferase (PAPS reductase)/FAD synthetase